MEDVSSSSTQDSTLNNGQETGTGADSSAAATSTEAPSAPDTGTTGVTGASGWGRIFQSETPDTDTQAESAAVAKEGAETDTEDATDTSDAAGADAQVPWHNDPRWKAWQAEKALLDQAKPLIEPLLQQFGGIEGVNAELARQAQQEQLQQQREVERQDQEAIEQRLQAQMQTGELDESAHQQALHYEVANARLYRVEMAGAVGTAAQQFPDMDRDLVSAFASDPEMVQTIAAHTHGRVAALKAEHAQALAAKDAESQAALKTAGERAVAEYVAANKGRLAQPPAEGGGGTGPGGPIDRNNLGGWGKILKAGRG